MRKPSPTIRGALKKARTTVMSDDQVAQGNDVLPDTDTEDADAQSEAPDAPKGKKKQP